MKPTHTNWATFAGIVEELYELEPGRFSRPVLKFYLNTTRDLAGGLEIGNRHRCLAVGETAEELAKTIREGAVMRVEGPLHVNSRARRDLYQLIAKIAVRRATVIHPAPTARQLLARVFGVPGLEPSNTPLPPRLKSFATNEVHLVGKVIGVGHVDGYPRVTLCTRAPFRATHDVVFWGEKVDEGITIGAIAEVRGLLSHHIENWSDDQVRLLSRVHSEHLRVFDGSPFASPSVTTCTRLAAPQEALPLN